MSITKNQLKKILTTLEMRPSKKLGQNFLIDENVASWIVAQLKLDPDDIIIEVGAGLGTLTRHIVNTVSKVVLIEWDSRLVDFLRQQFCQTGESRGKESLYGDVEVWHADAARVDIRKFFPDDFAGRRIKLLGNLPYSSASAIMKNLLSIPTPVSQAIIMLQLEVCQRICAEAGSKTFSALSLGVQLDWQADLIKSIHPQVFHPRPKVFSGVIRLERRRADEFGAINRPLFFRLVKAGFSQRRKQIKKLLPFYLLGKKKKSKVVRANENLNNSDIWKNISAQLDIEESARAEQISLQKWVKLAQIFYDSGAGIKDINIGGNNFLKYDDVGEKKSLAQQAEEIFDVVDEDNKKTTTATRAEVHEKNLRHRAVHILLFNKHGEVLLQMRSTAKDKNPSVWDSSASGHLDAGEGYLDSARRELAEELGLQKNSDADSDLKLKKVAELPASQKNGWEFIEAYAVRYEKKMGKIIYNPHEIDYLMWFDFEFVKDWSDRFPHHFAGGFLEIVRAL